MTALVLCGGGSRGAVEVGLYRALVELDIRVDLIVGTSVGAINGAAIASGMPPGELAGIWLVLKPRELFRVNRQLLTRLVWAESLYDHEPRRRFLQRRLPAQTFEALKVPLIVTATSVQTGELVTLRHGALLDVVMASVSMPGLFPPWLLGGVQLVDGGVSANVPLEVPLTEGADTVIFALCGCCERRAGRVRGFLPIVVRALSIAIDRKYLADLGYYGTKLTMVRITPPIPDVHLLDFSRTAELIETGYRHPRARLEELRGCPTS